MGLSEIKAHTRQQRKPKATRKKLPSGTKKPAAGSKQPDQSPHIKLQRQHPVIHGKVAPKNRRRARIMVNLATKKTPGAKKTPRARETPAAG